MHGAAGFVADKTGQTEAFGDNALTCEGGISVQQDGHHLDPVFIVLLPLLGAHFAENHRVHCFKVTGVRRQGQVNGIAVKFTIRAGAKVIFYVARAFNVVRFKATALEFVENRAVRLCHHVGKNRQAATVRHTDDDLLQTQRSTAFDDLLHCRNKCFAAIQPKAFGTHVFNMEEFFETFGLDQFVQDRLTTFAGEPDFLAVAFDTLFQPSRLFGVRDMHVLQRKSATIGPLHNLNDLAHRGDLQPENIVDKDRTVHVGFGKAIGFRIKLWMRSLVAHSKRIKVGNQMAPDTVSTDQHQRAD